MGLVDATLRAVVEAVAGSASPAPPVWLRGPTVRIALLADWTPVALGLGLHHVAAVAAQTGPRSEPLVLLADELLHRLDLAHLHAVSPSDLSSPRSVADLLLGTDRAAMTRRSGFVVAVLCIAACGTGDGEQSRDHDPVPVTGADDVDLDVGRPTVR